MKKAGLISVAAAVALASSAFAGEVKISADATVKGLSETVMAKEAKEFYNMEVNLGVEAKNDDGITLKAGWVIYDGQMGNVAGTDGDVKPDLDYGYIIAPLTPELTLKSGYVEAGPFGSNLTNSGNSSFKPFAIDYKVADGINVGLEEIMTTESDSANEGGGMIGSAGDDDKSATRIYVKGKAGDIGYGVRSTMTQTGKTATAEEKSDNQIELYVSANVAGVGILAHYTTVDGDSYDDAETGLYAHALLSPVEGLTTGVALLNLAGYTAKDELNPTYIVEEIIDDLGGLKSSKDEATSLVVIPVIYAINDKLTAEAKIATGSVNTDTVGGADKAESYTEIDLGLNVALGKATNLKVMYATASGDAVKGGAGAEDGVSLMGWALSTAF